MSYARSVRATPVFLGVALLATRCTSIPAREGSAADAAVPRDAGPRTDTHRDAQHDANNPKDARVLPDADAASDAAHLEAASTSGDASPASDARAPSLCADGASVAYTRTSCAGAATTVPAGLASAASSASFGDVVSLDGLDESSVGCFPVRVCVAKAAPTLLFSDEPESPSADGVLYADELGAGAYRAYVYHVNAGTNLRKFPVVLLNQGATTVHATLTAVGLAGPSQDYVDVGKQAAVRWYMSQGTTTTVDVPAGERVLLDADLDGLQAATSELVHAILDFSLDGPAKISVVSLDATEDATTATAGLSLLANTGQHTRGSFPGAALEIESIAPLDSSGARRLRMGGDVTDATLTGTDYVDNGMAVTLEGNYGVSYAVKVSFATAIDSAILLSPQGGDWGGAGFDVAGSSAASTPGVLPASQDSLGTQTDAIAVATFSGVPSGTIDFLSAGGSDLPVDVLVVPSP